MITLLLLYTYWSLGTEGRRSPLKNYVIRRTPCGPARKMIDDIILAAAMIEPGRAEHCDPTCVNVKFYTPTSETT